MIDPLVNNVYQFVVEQAKAGKTTGNLKDWNTCLAGAYTEKYFSGLYNPGTYLRINPVAEYFSNHLEKHKDFAFFKDIAVHVEEHIVNHEDLRRKWYQTRTIPYSLAQEVMEQTYPELLEQAA